MSSKSNTLPNPLRNLRRKSKRSPPDSRRRFHRRRCSAATVRGSTPTPSDDVSAKLEALQSLIPPQSSSAAAHGEPRLPEQLFKETADYIVLLKTQALVLQKLVDFFGSACNDPQNAVVS